MRRGARYTEPVVRLTKSTPSQRRIAAGFSTAELIIVVAIITMMSAFVLTSFTGIREGTSVGAAARELALAVRREQSISLAVSRVDTDVGQLFAPVVGLKLVQGSRTYFMFADIDKSKTYGAGDGKIGQDTVLEGTSYIRKITYRDALQNPQTAPVAHLMSAAPEATLTFSDDAGVSLGDVLEIELSGSSGNAVRTVTVRTSGQVSIKSN